ncbi:MAG: hypothetical protein Fur0037_25000 [Planctomycetota bacterium]
MPRAFAWFLALRYLASRPVTWIGVVGTAIAVWALIVVIAVFSGFIGAIRDDVRHSAPDLLLTDLPLQQSYSVLRTRLVEDQDVLAVAPRLRHYGTFQQLAEAGLVHHSSTVDFNSKDSDFVQLLGIDPELEARVTPLADWIAADTASAAQALDVSDAEAWHGRQRAGLPLPDDPKAFANRWPGIRLGRERIAWRRLQPGDPIEVLTATLSPRGGEGSAGGEDDVQPVAARFAYAGSFKTGHRMFDDSTALIPIEALRTMLGHDAESDDSIDIVTDVAIAVRPGADSRAVASRLRQALLPLFPEGGSFEVLEWEEQNQVFLDAVEVERAMMKIVLLAVMLLAAFLIYATLHMMVSQKVKDIGILGSLGGSPSSVGATFLVCGAAIGAFGCSLGVLLGALNTIYLNPILDALGIRIFPPEIYDLREVPARLDPLWVLQVSCGAFLLSLLVSWMPARRAARLEPVEALSYE